MATVFTYWLGH